MLYVCAGFLEELDCILTGTGTTAKSIKLRKDEPHPVSLLVARHQFSKGMTVDICLSQKKPAQLVWILDGV
jgi:hypothetical protein